MRAQADHPLLVGAVVVIYRRNTYQQHGEYNLFQNAEFKANLRDEYLTSAVRTKEGDKAGSSQPPYRDQTNIPVRGRVVVLNCKRSRYADWWI